MVYRPSYYRGYVDDMIVLFKSSVQLKRFQSCLNSCQVNMSFTIETEQNSKIFLDVNVIGEQDKFITRVYGKPTFNGVYTHFDSFLHDPYKIGMIYTLVNICFRICSSWSVFHHELILLREIFQNNDNPENFIDRCSKLFLNRIHILKEKKQPLQVFCKKRCS